jgi:thiol:disulfide interchange protein DsbA
MNNSLKNLSKLFLICFLSISVSAEYKLGRDYRLVDSPLPVKRDGVVEVTESCLFGFANSY